MQESCLAFLADPHYQLIQKQRHALAAQGLAMPFFIEREGINDSTVWAGGRQLVNFSSYNYLGLAGHPEIIAAAKQAIDRYGTSVSASRVISGEIPLHRALERELADFLGVDDAVLFVSGHATNVSTVGHIVGPGDLILHDAQIHNSALEGARLSGARQMPFRHNDCAHLERLLARHRARHRQVLILVEGVCSIHGDIADLPGFIRLKKRHQALLMVDEAHSIGVLGATGRGIGEHFGVDRRDVDVWMGTLSKSLASCGGYIAGSAALVDCLKHTSPGFVYSVGMAPASAAAALAALRMLQREPGLLATLHARAALFLQLARAHGLDTGLSQGTPLVPLVTGSALAALRMSHDLLAAGISVPPFFYPAVRHRQARLRFFLTAHHTEAQVRHAVAEAARLKPEPSGRSAQVVALPRPALPRSLPPPPPPLASSSSC